MRVTPAMGAKYKQPALRMFGVQAAFLKSIYADDWLAFAVIIRAG